MLNNDEDMDLIIALPTTVENADESDGAFYSENSNRANEGGNRRAEMKSVDHMDLEMLLENYLNEVIIFYVYAFIMLCLYVCFDGYV